jgi:hypothetical protein
MKIHAKAEPSRKQGFDEPMLKIAAARLRESENAKNAP